VKKTPLFANSTTPSASSVAMSYGQGWANRGSHRSSAGSVLFAISRKESRRLRVTILL
jgi:hypothetical protein